MVKLSPLALETVEKAGETGCVFTTLDSSGHFYADRFAFVKVHDEETILFSDLYSDDEGRLTEKPGNAEVLKANPNISFYLVDPSKDQLYKRANFRCEGIVSTITSGEVLEEMSRWLKDRRPEIQLKSVYLVKLTEVNSLKEGVLCTFCGYWAKDRKDLNEHKRYEHWKEKPELVRPRY